MKRDLTLEALAEATGISPSTLSRLEAGKRAPNLELLLPVTRVLRLSLDDLLMWTAPDPRGRARNRRFGNLMVEYLSPDGAPVQTFKMTLTPSDEPIQFRVQDLPKNIRHFAFLSGYRAPKREIKEQEAVTVKAARAMGALYDALLGDVDVAQEDHDSRQASIFMTRLLFLLYGDDAEGLPATTCFEVPPLVGLKQIARFKAGDVVVEPVPVGFCGFSEIHYPCVRF